MTLTLIPLDVVGMDQSRLLEELQHRRLKYPAMTYRLVLCLVILTAALFYFKSIAKPVWDAGARIHEAKGHTNYVEFLAWSGKQKRCWRSLRDAAMDFEQATGKAVKWDL